MTTTSVTSGVTSSGLTISSGTLLKVYSSGTTSAITVVSGGVETILNGGKAFTTTAELDGVENISAGGSATSTFVSSGGTENVFSGGLTIGTQIGSGAYATVFNGGTAKNTQVEGGAVVSGHFVVGGIEYVSSGGTTSGTTLSGLGAYQIVANSGTASGTSVGLFGYQFVSAGGHTVSTNVASGGHEIVSSGAVTTGTSIASGGLEIISSGATASNTTISAGGVLFVSGGTASGTTVDSGGILIVSSGANIGATTVNSGGEFVILPGASHSGTTNMPGDILVTSGVVVYQPPTTVSNYATLASGVTVTDGGIEYVLSGGTASATNLTSGSQEIVYAGGSGSGDVVSSSALATVSSGGTEFNAEIAGGTLDVVAGGTLSGATFSGTGGDLQLDGLTLPTTTISGFATGDEIDLTNYLYVPDLVASATSNTLNIPGLGVSLNIAGAGDDTFHLAADTGTGTLITLVTPCFLAGTMILTDKGEVPVENLAIGDAVITLTGAAQKIKWLGRRSYRQPFAATNADITPILITKDAIAANQPVRDLYVSPLHAMYIDNVLVPAGLLVNGASIRRCPHITDINYIHIELDEHSVIFAESAPTETFVDCDSRMMFHNAAEFAQLYPGDTAEPWAFCAPRVETGQTLRRIQRALSARAGLTPGAGLAPPEARLEGHLDRLEQDRVFGWAWLPDYPDEAVELEVLDQNGLLARITADRLRPDLAAAGIGDGRHAFEMRFANGFTLTPDHEIHVRRAACATPLSHSPAVLPVTLPATPQAAIHQLPQRLITPLARPALRALVLDALWPNPSQDAGSTAILSHIAALQSLGYAVDLIATREMDQTPPASLTAAGITCHAAPAHATVESVLRQHGEHYNLVYMHRLEVAAAYAGLVRAHCHGPKAAAHTIYSVADLHHLRFTRQAQIQNDPAIAKLAAATRQQELFVMRQVDSVITHSSAEAAYLARIAPGINVHTVPWAVPTGNRPDFSTRTGIAFIGSYRHAPNVDAADWLLNDIMPLVWQQNPDITCTIAGSGWTRQALPNPDPRITLAGPVETLNTIFDTHRLTVAPLRFGAGIKGKILESLAAGLPCAMTPIAAEGIALPAIMQSTIAPTAETLATLICHLHTNQTANTTLAKTGQQTIHQHYNPTTTRTALTKACTPTPQAWPLQA